MGRRVIFGLEMKESCHERDHSLLRERSAHTAVTGRLSDDLLVQIFYKRTENKVRRMNRIGIILDLRHTQPASPCVPVRVCISACRQGHTWQTQPVPCRPQVWRDNMENVGRERNKQVIGNYGRPANCIRVEEHQTLASPPRRTR